MASAEAVQRRYSSQNAVENRRECRRLRRGGQVQREKKRRRREEQEGAVAKKMVMRFYGHEFLYAIVFSYSYWLARRCGWDACHVSLRRLPDKTICEPSESPFWKWWTELHWQHRQQIVAMSGGRLRREGQCLSQSTT